MICGGGEEDLEGNVEGKEMSSPSRTIDPDPKLAKLRGGLAGGGAASAAGSPLPESIETASAFRVAASGVVSAVSEATLCGSPSLWQPLSEGASIAIEAPSVIVLVSGLSLVSLSMPKG